MTNSFNPELLLVNYQIKNSFNLILFVRFYFKKRADNY